MIKPDPRIFAIALDQLGCVPDEAMMVGDNWSADIVGAQAAGLRAVWINRYGRTSPDPTLAVEINALEPVDAVFDLLINGHHAG
jgi:putative hydrolase of the HAD superfamily